MELIRINGTKLKVMLDPADMEKFALDSSDIDYEDATTRRAFRAIFEEVRDVSDLRRRENRCSYRFFPPVTAGVKCLLPVCRRISRPRPTAAWPTVGSP